MRRTIINADADNTPETKDVTPSKTDKDNIIAQISLQLAAALIDMQLDERIFSTDSGIINQLHTVLSRFSKSLESVSAVEVKTLNDPEFATMLLQELNKHYTFIRSLFEYEGMLTGYYHTATIPLTDDKSYNFERHQVQQAMKALDKLSEYTNTSWQSNGSFIQTLIAPIIFYNIFFAPSAQAIDFYLAHFNDSMLKTAKEFIKQHPYSIYKGRSSISADLIFTRFAEDKSFISSLLPPNDRYLVYTVFTNCKLEYAKICWAAANDEQKKLLLEVACRRLGDVFPPALVSACQSANEDMVNWLWSLANTLELKKYLLQTLMDESRRNPVILLFSTLAERDHRYFAAAIKIALREEQYFIDLAENNNYILLFAAANLKSYDFIKKYLDNKHEPLDLEIYNKLHSVLTDDSLIKQLQRLEPPKRSNTLN